MSYETVTLSRDVVGVLIPAGTRVELPEGAEASITQALGGSYTLQMQGHLFRIEGKDADAIGKTPAGVPDIAPDASEDEVEQAVWQQMKTCYDPEIPIDVVELGLIYECRLEPAEEGGWRVRIIMTLTAPGCGMGDYLKQDVEQKILGLPGVKAADVQVVLDPPWSQSMMSDAARLQLGLM